MLGFFATVQDRVSETPPEPIAEVVTRGPPAAPVAQALGKPVPTMPDDVMDEVQMAEYAEVAASIGLESSELAIEAFRLFLTRHDIPVFSIPEVARYMDALTARDNPSKFGWHWCPVRARDKEPAMLFGTPAVHDQSGLFGNVLLREGAGGGGGGFGGVSAGLMGGAQQSMSALAMGSLQQGRLMNELAQYNALSAAALGQSASYFGPTHRKPGSDYYSSTQVALYRRAIPLHALRKIALVEKEFAGPIRPVFLVTEYTTEAQVVIKPDPFLMAVIPNDLVAQGHGRFIIDVWDEPGFGIAQMVK